MNTETSIPSVKTRFMNTVLKLIEGEMSRSVRRINEINNIQHFQFKLYCATNTENLWYTSKLFS